MPSWWPWRKRSRTQEPDDAAEPVRRTGGEAGGPGSGVGWLLGLLVLGLFGLIGWRAWMLRGLPVVPEPVDLAALRAVMVPDDRNAMLVYRDAAAGFPVREEPPYRTSGALAWQVDDWARAEPGLQRYVRDHRDALAAWLAGTERPEALGVSLTTVTLAGPQPHLDWVERPARVALLEASRRQLEGPADPAGVWRLYAGVLRASRHVGQHGGAFERMTGYGLLRQARPGIERWAAAPAVDATLLRQALADVQGLDALTPPDSQALQFDYLRLANELDAPGYASTLATRMRAAGAAPARLPLGPELTLLGFVEPERSRRLLRLLHAHWLPDIDRPERRATLTAQGTRGVYLFDPRPGQPPPTRPLAGQRAGLDAQARSTLMAPRWLSLVADLLPTLEADRRLRAELVVSLASALWTREHGSPPPGPEALVGPYLDHLPAPLTPPPGTPAATANPGGSPLPSYHRWSHPRPEPEL